MKPISNKQKEVVKPISNKQSWLRPDFPFISIFFNFSETSSTLQFNSNLFARYVTVNVLSKLIKTEFIQENLNYIR